MSTPPVPVEIRDRTIRLGQLLKLANLVEHGGHARAVIAAGEVEVDGRVVTGRGSQVTVGSVVRLGDATVVVVSRGA